MCLNLNLQFLCSAALLCLYSELMQMMHLTKLKNGEKSIYVCRHLMNKFIPSLWQLLLVLCVMLLALQANANALMTA